MLNALYNMDIERAVISTFVFFPEELDKIENLPNPSVFYEPFYRHVYESILYLYDNEKGIIPETVKAELVSKNKYDEFMFLGLMEAYPLSNVKLYIKDLVNFERKRALRVLSREINSMLEEESESHKVLDEVERRIFALSDYGETKRFVPVGSAVSSAIKRIREMRKNPDNFFGFDTGIHALNEHTGGFAPGDLVILASRPSVGKTALANKIMLSAAKAGNGVGFFSLEMSEEQISYRLISMESGVPLSKCRSGRVDDAEYRRIEGAQRVIDELDIHIDDSSSVNLRKLRSKIRGLISRNKNINIVIIDYLQLIENISKKDRYVQVGDISRTLKIIAKELGIAIIALSQLSRAPESRENKRPIPSDLRESGSLEQDADIILFLYSDEIYRKLEEDEKAANARKKGMKYIPKYINEPVVCVELIIGKQRNGPLETILLEFVKNITLFRDYRE